MSCRAVLFDFDGVVARTMEDNYRAWSSALSEYGLRLEREAYFLLEGMSPIRIAETLLERAGHDIGPAAEVARLKEERYIRLHHFEVYPDAKRVIEELRKRGIRLGLVTGGSARRIQTTLPQELLSCFDAIVTAESTSRGKPGPDPYLLAAQRLDVPPSECVVVENAPLGIEAARRAGMLCVAVCSTLSAEHLRPADFIIEELGMLEAVLPEGTSER